jgi:hypothetical protein
MRSLAYAVAVLAACSYPNKSLVPGDSRGDAAVSTDANMPGDYVWIRSMSSLGALGIADGSTGLITTSYLSGPADLGSGQILTIGINDIVIAGFTEDDASLSYMAHWGYADANEYPWLRYDDSGGAPLVWGIMSNSNGGTMYDVGKGPGTNLGGWDGFIGRYGPSAPNWVATLGGSSDDQFSTTALGAGSTIYGAGWFDGTATFNGSSYVSAGSDDILLARFDTYTGAVDLTKQFGGTGADDPDGAAPRADGGLVLTGSFGTTIDFGGATSTMTSAGGLDVFVVALDDTGAGEWARSFGGSGDDYYTKVVTDSLGNVYVTGVYQDTVTFGTNTFTSNGGNDIFVVKLDGSTGAVLWSIAYGGTGDDRPGGIDVDASGRVVVSAWVTGLAGQDSLGGADGLVSELSGSDGSVNWQKFISTPGDDRGGAVLYGVSGDIYCIMGLGGAFDFGQPMIGAASPASVILRIKP